MMALQELHIKLKELGISEDRYYLHGFYGSTDDEGKLSLIIRKGKYSLEFEVYYKERGEKDSLIKFLTEDEACQYIYKCLKKNKEMEDQYLK